MKVLGADAFAEFFLGLDSSVADPLKQLRKRPYSDACENHKWRAEFDNHSRSTEHFEVTKTAYKGAIIQPNCPPCFLQWYYATLGVRLLKQSPTMRQFGG